MRDTQKSMYALDLRPGAFKISRNEGVNLANPSVTAALESFSHPELVASTFSLENNRMVPGITSRGPRIITFDAILKYGRFPLAQILKDILEICKQELMCDVEMEFAADLVSNSRGQELQVKLLQVRPVGEYTDDDSTTMEKVSEEIKTMILSSSKALGSGSFDGMKYIIHVPSTTFDSARTKDMAEEISRLNSKIKNEEDHYLLIGPGRWGSSDPWLGIPVVWSDISEAKMIVETAIPGFQIEPSQGTHFFQNITSLGVGYLTIDTVNKDGSIDESLISSLECLHDGEFVKLYKAPDTMLGYIDRSNNKAILGY